MPLLHTPPSRQAAHIPGRAGAPVPTADAVCGVLLAALRVGADHEAPALGGDGRPARLAWGAAEQANDRNSMCGCTESTGQPSRGCLCSLPHASQQACSNSKEPRLEGVCPLGTSPHQLPAYGTLCSPSFLTWAAHAAALPPVNGIAAAQAVGLIVVPLWAGGAHG